MKSELVGNPDFGNIHFVLDRGDQVLAEAGGMAAMDSDVEVQVHTMGGFLPALMRRVLTGTSLLMGQYTSPADGRRLQISPPTPGHVVHRPMNGDPLYLTGGGFLACTPGVKIGTVFGGIKAIFSREGLFFLRLTGSGDLWINAYGEVIEHDLSTQGELIVDGGYALAWDGNTQWEIRLLGNLMTTLFSGEGLVMRFYGTGRVWLQTRSVGGVADWLSRYCR